MSWRARHIHSDSQGIVLLEFILVFFVFFLLVASVIDFSRIVRHRSHLIKGVELASKAAALTPDTCIDFNAARAAYNTYMGAYGYPAINLTPLTATYARPIPAAFGSIPVWGMDMNFQANVPCLFCGMVGLSPNEFNFNRSVFVPSYQPNSCP